MPKSKKKDKKKARTEADGQGNVLLAEPGIWKLSGMDLESHRRWYDFSRARDAMFAATDTEVAPWYVVNADDPRRARLNCISHLLSKVPYEELPREPVKLGKRQPSDGYVEPQWRRHVVPEPY